MLPFVVLQCVPSLGWAPAEPLLVPRRRGISLMEVLISMFVMLVGLVGVAALIPAGRFELAEGVKQERAAAVGRLAFREIKTRGFLQAEMPVPGSMITGNPAFVGEQHLRMWIRVPQTSETGQKRGAVPTGHTVSSLGSGGPTFPQGIKEYYGLPLPPGVPLSPSTQRFAYALDPLVLCWNVWDQRVPAPTAMDIQRVSTFPGWSYWYVDTLTEPRFNQIRATEYMVMDRICYRSVMPTPAVGNAPFPLEKAFPWAESIFRISDDLSFKTERGSESPAEQVMAARTDGNMAKRQSAGDFSWMATIVPLPDKLTSNAFGAFVDYSRPWRVSVAVFSKRVLDVVPLGGAEGPPERVVEFVQPRGGAGVGGGEIELRAIDAGGGLPANVLNLRRGQWIMLSQWPVLYPNQTGVPPVPLGQPRFNWCRVVAAGEIVKDSPQLWRRQVTLSGPDLLSDGKTGQGSIRLINRAAIVDNLVGVYEKDIHLEQASQWSMWNQ